MKNSRGWRNGYRLAGIPQHGWYGDTEPFDTLYTVRMRAPLLILAFLLASPAHSLAQSLDLPSVGSGEDLFSVSVSPDYPSPYGQAIVSVLPTASSLSSATLRVRVNGTQVYEGNVRPVPVTLKGPGTPVEVTVTVSDNGSVHSKSLTLQPEDVSLIAEPIATAPPLYAGKALPPMGGSVRVVAVAAFKDSRGRAIDPSALSYAWSVDGARLASASGLGKTAIVVATPLQYRERTVSVSIKTVDGALVGGASLSLFSSSPTVRIYESDPLLGVRFDRALLGSYAIRGSETTLYAAPFSFPKGASSPVLRWFLNGLPAQTENLITLRPSGDGEGIASLSLTASASGSVGATTVLSLSFGSKPSTNFFGL